MREQQVATLTRAAGEREPEVFGYLRQVEDSMSELSNLTAELAQRLAPVLDRNCAGAECSDEKAPQPSAPLAERLSCVNNVVRNEIEHVRYLLRRLEI